MTEGLIRWILVLRCTIGSSVDRLSIEAVYGLAKRAVEGMARCGIDFDGLCKAFPGFPVEEIERVYMQVRKMGNKDGGEQDIKCCGSDAR